MDLPNPNNPETLDGEDDCLTTEEMWVELYADLVDLQKRKGLSSADPNLLSRSDQRLLLDLLLNY